MLKKVPQLPVFNSQGHKQAQTGLRSVWIQAQNISSILKKGATLPSTDPSSFTPSHLTSSVRFFPQTEPDRSRQSHKHANKVQDQFNKNPTSKMQIQQLYHCSNPFGETTAHKCARPLNVLMLVFFKSAILILLIIQQFAKNTNKYA